MTKSKAQQAREARAAENEQRLIDDPGKSPSDVNKNTGAGTPVSNAFSAAPTPAKPITDVPTDTASNPSGSSEQDDSDTDDKDK